MKILSATYPDFIRFDEKPNEDFFLVSKGYPIFSVADGVTQSHFKNGKYAYPSGAKEAAQIFCRTSVKVLEKTFNNLTSKNIEGAFRDAFNSANQEIKKLNLRYGIDKKLNYVEYDWFDTVGIAGAIIKNRLYFDYAGDCGLVIFDKNNHKKLQTRDDVRPAVKKFEKLYPKHNLNERTLIMHRDFRNNPNGNGYGSFSGEAGVERYYHFGSTQLTKGDLIIFYSDGLIGHLKIAKFIKLLRSLDKKDIDAFIMEKASSNPAVYGNDRTFVSIII